MPLVVLDMRISYNSNGTPNTRIPHISHAYYHSVAELAFYSSRKKEMTSLSKTTNSEARLLV